jgi:hypothetical protein
MYSISERSKVKLYVKLERTLMSAVLTECALATNAVHMAVHVAVATMYRLCTCAITNSMATHYSSQHSHSDALLQLIKRHIQVCIYNTKVSI